MHPTRSAIAAALSIAVAVLGLSVSADYSPQPPSFYNDFDVSDSLIPLNAIDHGGPGRDGIPALDRPQFLSGRDRDSHIRQRDRVMGVSLNGLAKAYPINILDHHEVVNDRFGDTAITITFCPLCGTGMVFHAQVQDRELDFGVSGLLYNSGLLLYDRATGSLWSQIMKVAVTGPLKGEKLVQIPAQYTTWASWSKEHPESLLLSSDTGHERDYGGELYARYRRLPAVMYSTGHQDQRLAAKEWVVGIEVGERSVAVPFSALYQLDGPLRIKLGGEAIVINWDREGSAARVFDSKGDEIPATAGYWFAWVAFYPDTALYPVDLQP